MRLAIPLVIALMAAACGGAVDGPTVETPDAAPAEDACTDAAPQVTARCWHYIVCGPSAHFDFNACNCVANDDAGE